MKGLTAFCLAAVFLAVPAARAQAPANPQPTASEIRFLTAYRARLGAARLDRNDKAYTWDGRIAGDIDLIDYGRGRLNFFSEYEVVLGSQLRAFDPNQSLYTLELRGTRWVGRNELAGVFHHISRHLSDRAKTQSVDWNQIAAEVQRSDPFGRLQVESRVRGAWVVKRTYVDYRWQIDGRLHVLRPMTPRTRLLAEGAIRFMGVERRIANRGTQVGTYLEGGTRLLGSNGSLDLILAVERRIDGDVLTRGPKSWIMLGFRLLSS